MVARKDVTLDWDKFERVFDSPGELAVFRNRRALPRASVAQDAIVVNDQDAAWQAIHAADFDPSRQVVVEGGEALRGGVGAAAAVTTVANGLDVDVQTRAPAYLVISQPFYSCLLYTSPIPRDRTRSRMPSFACKKNTP